MILGLILIALIALWLLGPWGLLIPAALIWVLVAS